MGDALREALIPLAAQIRVAFIYGSLARGEEVSRSDVDVMLIGKVTFDEAVQALRSAEERIGREVNPSVYTPSEFRSKIAAQHPFLTTVLNSPKIFLIGDKHDLTGLAENWLIEHQATPQEIGGLLSVADRELADAQVNGLSVDARFTHAYGVALQCSLAALAAAGYRVSKGVSHHHYALHSLAHTLSCEPGLIAKLDKLRKKRNISEYEQAGAISDQEAGEMIKIAKSLRADVETWLRGHHPELLRSE